MTRRHLTAAAFEDSVTVVGDLNAGPIIQGSGDYSTLGDLDVQGPAIFYSTVRLAADPTTALQAATKQYVDAKVVGLNEVYIGNTDPGAAYELWVDTT